MKVKLVILILAILFFMNLIAHFLPFERSSLAPDDYWYFLWINSSQPSDALHYILKYFDRPVDYLLLDLQFKVTGLDPNKNLIFVFLSSLFILSLTFLLLKKLLKSLNMAFLATCIYSLLPNKLEVYHLPIYANLSIIMGIYILSFLLFIYYLEKNKLIYLFLSILAYAIGIFGYEVGFFLPAIMFVYSVLFAQKKPKACLFYFIALIIIYVIYRFTGVFGLFDLSGGSRKPALLFSPVIELFHHYAGRYLFRNILYGFYKFFSIELRWLIIIIISDIFLLLILGSYLKKISLEKVGRRLLLFAVFIFILFLMPIMLSAVGGIGGRHLVLPSIGLVILLLWCLEKTGKQWRAVFLWLTAFFLIVSQGNSWTQVVACRINGAFFEAMQERKKELSAADYVIIDAKSFADSIDFTWIKRDFNVLSTYYGAQALEDRGLESMVRLITGDSKKSVYVVKDNPRIKENGTVEFSVSDVVKYRKILKKNIVLSREGSLILNFEDVYGNNFNNGIRKK